MTAPCSFWPSQLTPRLTTDPRSDASRRSFPGEGRGGSEPRSLVNWIVPHFTECALLASREWNEDPEGIAMCMCDLSFSFPYLTQPGLGTGNQKRQRAPPCAAVTYSTWLSQARTTQTLLSRSGGYMAVGPNLPTWSLFLFLCANKNLCPLSHIIYVRIVLQKKL